jgi:hypothetical protein
MVEARRRERGDSTNSTISPRAPGPNRTKGTTQAERDCACRGDIQPWDLSEARFPMAEAEWTLCAPCSFPALTLTVAEDGHSPQAHRGYLTRP